MQDWGLRTENRTCLRKSSHWSKWSCGKGCEGTREGSSPEQSRRGWTPELWLPWCSRRNKNQAQANIKANCSQSRCVLSSNCSLVIIQGVLENSTCVLSKGQGGDGQHVPQTHSCAVPATALAQGSDGSSHIHSITASTAPKWSPCDLGSMGFGASLGFRAFLTFRVSGIWGIPGIWSPWDLESRGFRVPGIWGIPRKFRVQRWDPRQDCASSCLSWVGILMAQKVRLDSPHPAVEQQPFNKPREESVWHHHIPALAVTLATRVLGL